jgi:hypothetical protein
MFLKPVFNTSKDIRIRVGFELVGVYRRAKKSFGKYAKRTTHPCKLPKFQSSKINMLIILRILLRRKNSNRLEEFNMDMESRTLR